MAKIPTRAADLAALANRVVNAWANHPNITLLWMTQADAATKVSDYNSLILSSSQSKNNSRASARDLRDQEKVMDRNLDNLKKLIQLEHGKNNLAQRYAAYGIVFAGSGYRLPADRDDRLQSLRIMVAKLATASFKNHTYGESFWTDILNQYETTKSQLETEVGSVSVKVEDKKALQEEIRILMISIRKLIEANYPYNAEGMLRDWGFQDERN